MHDNRLKCARPECGWEWTPRVDDPVECPNCKARRHGRHGGKREPVVEEKEVE